MRVQLIKGLFLAVLSGLLALGSCSFAYGEEPVLAGMSVVHLLNTGSPEVRVSAPEVFFFERLLRERWKDIRVRSVKHIPCLFNGNLYLYRLPEGVEIGDLPADNPARFFKAEIRTVQVLETGYVFFVQVPGSGPHPAGDLAAGLGSLLAQKGALYGSSPRNIEMRTGQLGGFSWRGARIPAVVVKTPRDVVNQWRRGVALIYTLEADAKKGEAVFFLKTIGGISRLSTLSKQFEKRYGPEHILVSRGNIIHAGEQYAVRGTSLIETLEDIGLKVCGVGSGEMKHWEILSDYRRKKPQGIKFVSANLVYSTSPAGTVPPALGPFPPYTVEKVGEKKLAFLGITNPRLGSYLSEQQMKGLVLLDPVTTAGKYVPDLRSRADLVIVLSSMYPADNLRLKNSARGIDLILSDRESLLPGGPDLPKVSVLDAGRGPFSGCLLVASDYDGSVTHLKIRSASGAGYQGRLAPSADLRGPFRRAQGPLKPQRGVGPAVPQKRGCPIHLEVEEDFIVLDESIVDDAALEKFSARAFDLYFSTENVLIPSPSIVYPKGKPGSQGGVSFYSGRDFWTLSGALLSEMTRSEAAIMPVFSVKAVGARGVTEKLLRKWLSWDDALVTFEIPGSVVSEMVKRAENDRLRESANLPRLPGHLPIAVCGLGPKNTIHGLPIKRGAMYKVASSDALTSHVRDFPWLSKVKNLQKRFFMKGARIYGHPRGQPLLIRDAVLAGVKKKRRKRLPAGTYRRLMEGLAEKETPLWTINFRDVSLNVSNTQVVRDEGLSRIPNSRIQGFNQFIIGGDCKVDVEYQSRGLRWTNTLAMEYSKSRVYPPGEPVVTNTPRDRLSFNTGVTKCLGDFPLHWLARSWGPSLGVEFEGQFERVPGLKRKRVYSVLPGVTLFSGKYVKSTMLTGNLKWDLSREPANSQYGVRFRVVGSVPFGTPRVARLQGEVWANYFVLTRHDTREDLRLEGDANLKLQIPLYRYLTLAPFVDIYFFQGKVTPASGYNVMMGISLGFSRVWKPQYARF